MTQAILLCLAGLVGLVIGGELLVRGSVAIARKLGISTLVTGLVIVGCATSMPEMVASVQAALAGAPGIAWGNVVGSNLANTLLILGATSLIAPIILSGLGRRDALVALACTIALLVIAYAGWGARAIGLVLVAALGVFIYWRYRVPTGGEEEDDYDGPALSNFVAISYFLAGLAALIIGGQVLVTGAIDLARLAGISETAIGLTVVAIGTSLPELAASIAAALRGKPGLAIGNVVGSNIYNILLIGGVTMMIAPQPVPTDLQAIQLPLLLASALLLVLILWHFKSISRWLGGLMVLLYLGNVALIFG